MNGNSPAHQQAYFLPAKTHQVELQIKGSQFIAWAAPTHSKPESMAFIQTLRIEHPQANHVCWAYIAGSPASTVRSMSDDGEPNGTAGRPMLKVLEYSGLGNIVVAVVRYFGGIKLGKGGLQRAYSDAVLLVLEDMPVQQYVSRLELALVYDYAYEDSISRLCNRYDGVDIVINYNQQVSMHLALANNQITQFKEEALQITAGKIRISTPLPI